MGAEMVGIIRCICIIPLNPSMLLLVPEIGYELVVVNNVKPKRNLRRVCDAQNGFYSINSTNQKPQRPVRIHSFGISRQEIVRLPIYMEDYPIASKCVW
ncbi:hypothetical protein SAY87_032044 [Trapa incisa]|uniref:Uncharacterized protein n=1 Tax=Trapa incisa TaxID=236973 RepID=A0AAN7QLH6_9MYRT|nr:hypothetical protein SAY87_032044 [Trapa incisa]